MFDPNRHPDRSPRSTKTPHRPRWIAAAVAAAVACVAGCQSSQGPSEHDIISKVNNAGPATTPGRDDPGVARLNGITVTRSSLDDLLYRSYGVGILANLVELDLAKQTLAQKGLTLTDADVAAERQRSMERFFPNEKPENYDQDFKQLKAEKHLTDVEFDLGFQTTAALRKIARPLVQPQVNDDAVRRAYGLLYGENRRIADIRVDNVVQVAQVQDALKTQPFDLVAKTRSNDPRTRERGGQWPPFSAKTPGVPTVVMEAAFGMKVGEVSKEPLVDGDQYHVIKLLEVVPPKVVNYDQVKDSVRQQVLDSLEQQAINMLRKQLQQAAISGIVIDDPTLKRAWDAMLAAQMPAGRTLSAKEASAAIDRAERPPATKPATP